MKEPSEIFRPDALAAFRGRQFDTSPRGLRSTWPVDAALLVSILGLVVLIGVAARTPIGDAQHPRESILRALMPWMSAPPQDAP